MQKILIFLILVIFIFILIKNIYFIQMYKMIEENQENCYEKFYENFQLIEITKQFEIIINLLNLSLCPISLQKEDNIQPEDNIKEEKLLFLIELEEKIKCKYLYK